MALYLDFELVYAFDILYIWFQSFVLSLEWEHQNQNAFSKSILLNKIFRNISVFRVGYVDMNWYT